MFEEWRLGLPPDRSRSFRLTPPLFKYHHTVETGLLDAVVDAMDLSQLWVG